MRATRNQVSWCDRSPKYYARRQPANWNREESKTQKPEKPLNKIYVFKYLLAKHTYIYMHICRSFCAQEERRETDQVIHERGPFIIYINSLRLYRNCKDVICCLCADFLTEGYFISLCYLNKIIYMRLSEKAKLISPYVLYSNICCMCFFI